MYLMTGMKRSGKDTVAGMLAKRDYENTTLVAFAGPLKAMIRALLDSAGLDATQIEYFMDGDGKEEPLDILQGKSCRYAMQKLGTEWRDFFGDNLWTGIVESRVDKAVWDAQEVVMTDMRFPHEGVWGDKYDGLRIRVRRAGQKLSSDPHPSETAMENIPVHMTIYNHGSLFDLETIVSAAYAILNKDIA